MAPFIVLEGLDGAGTTTQVGRLVDRLHAAGRSVVATREPTDRSVGRLIRRVLAGDPDAPSPRTLPWLFAADRSDHLEAVIEPALAAGTIIVSDRYYHSSLAYQSLVEPLERVHTLNATFRTPDLTVFVRVTPEEALSRIERRGGEREIFEQLDKLRAINDAYGRVIALLRSRGEPIVEVDGSASPEQVASAISALVDTL
jgi:dTMP kinase